MVGRTGIALGTRTSATGKKYVVQVRRVKGVKEQGEASLSCTCIFKANVSDYVSISLF